MNSSAIVALGFFALMAIMVIGGFVVEVNKKGRKKGDPPDPGPAAPASLSMLAGLSFFFGLGAIFLATVTGILTLMLSMGDLFPLSEALRRQIDLAGRVVLYTSLLPAVGAVAFALAARGVISESRGAVRGRPLYRTGILLSVITAVIVFDAKILDPATWVMTGGAGGRGGAGRGNSDIDRGYLGVEHGPLESSGCVTLLRVVPGSPAERAGLKAGDILMTLDGKPVHQLGSLADAIGSMKPGSQVTLGVSRGGKTVDVVAELSVPFAGLLAILEQQSLDEERLSVLKAAGSDRRYSARELTGICKTFDFDDGRMSAIEFALPNLQDPQNGYQILSTLEFSDAKKKAAEWIERIKTPK